MLHFLKFLADTIPVYPFFWQIEPDSQIFVKYPDILCDINTENTAAHCIEKSCIILREIVEYYCCDVRKLQEKFACFNKCILNSE